MPKKPKENVLINIEVVMHEEKEEATNVLPTNVEAVASPMKCCKATIEDGEDDEEMFIANGVVAIIEKEVFVNCCCCSSYYKN